MAISRTWTGVSIGVILLIATPATQAAERSSVAVTIENYAGISNKEVHEAEAQASRIYSTANIDIQWDAAGATGLRIAVVSPEMTSHLPSSKDALGFAPASASGERSVRAYVFAGKVQRAADQLRLAFAQLPGCAIAHELGHLLLPLNSHAESGIMRGAWDPSHLPTAGSEYLRFVPVHVQLLRQRLAAH